MVAIANAAIDCGVMLFRYICLAAALKSLHIIAADARMRAWVRVDMGLRTMSHNCGWPKAVQPELQSVAHPSAGTAELASPPLIVLFELISCDVITGVGRSDLTAAEQHRSSCQGNRYPLADSHAHTLLRPLGRSPWPVDAFMRSCSPLTTYLTTSIRAVEPQQEQPRLGAFKRHGPKSQVERRKVRQRPRNWNTSMAMIESELHSRLSQRAE